MQHVKRAQQLMAFGAPNKRMHTTPPQSPQNQLQWWSVADQLQYPLNVLLSQSCESSHTGDLKLTLGNIYFERVRVTDDADNEGNMKLEVSGRWPIIEKSGRYSSRVGQFLRFTLDVDKEHIVVADMGDDSLLVCSTTYGSQFYEYVLKDLISNIFVRVVTHLRKYGKNDLADRIREENITCEGWPNCCQSMPFLAMLAEVKSQVGATLTYMNKEGEHDVGDRQEAYKLLFPVRTVTTLIMLLHGSRSTVSL